MTKDAAMGVLGFASLQAENKVFVAQPNQLDEIAFLCARAFGVPDCHNTPNKNRIILVVFTKCCSDKELK